MYQKGKYAVGTVHTSTGKHVEAIVFSEMLNHQDIATRVFMTGTIIAAGFFDIRTDEEGQPKVVPYGESHSLRLSSRPDEDTPLLQKALGMWPYY